MARKTFSVIVVVAVALGVLLLAGCDWLFGGAPPGSTTVPPGVPTNLRVVETDATQVSLAWDAPTGTVATYEIDRSVGDDTSFVQLSSVAGTTRTHDDRDVDAESVYFYRVRAGNAAGFSGWSDVVEVATPPASELGAFDFFQDGAHENIGEFADDEVAFGFGDQPYDLEARVVNDDEPDRDWALFERDDDGFVDIFFPTSDFKEGENTIEARYVHRPTGVTGDPGFADVWKGYFGFGTDPQHVRVDIPEVAIHMADTVNDAVFNVHFQDPDVPFEVADFAYVMPNDFGELTIETTEHEELLEMILYSSNYEYASLFMVDNPDYVWEFEIFENTGAAFTGQVLVYEGGDNRPVEADDDAEAITLKRDHDGMGIDADIFVAPAIPLSEDHDDYNRDTGEFYFGDLAGDGSYELHAIWRWDGQQDWHSEYVDAAEEAAMPYDIVFDIVGPVMLVEHKHYVVNYYDRIENEMSLDTSLYDGHGYMTEVRLDRQQILDVLNDSGHELHDRVWMVLAEDHILAEATGTSFRNLTDFGFVEGDYQAIWKDPADPIFHCLPLVTGDALMLYYNKSLIDQGTVPVDIDELFAFDPANPPTGAAAWLAYPESHAYWLVPWLEGLGGSLVDANGDPNLDTSQMIEALEFVSNSTLRNLMIDDPNDDGWIDYIEADEAFVSGDVAMMINGDWPRGYYEDELGADLGVAILPQLTTTHTSSSSRPSPYSRTYGFMVVDQGDTALEDNLATMLSNALDETAIETSYTDYYNDGGSIMHIQYPAMIAARDLPDVTDGFIADYPTIYQNVTPQDPIDGEVWGMISGYIRDVLTDAMTPTEAAAGMQNDLP